MIRRFRHIPTDHCMTFDDSHDPAYGAWEPLASEPAPKPSWLTLREAEAMDTFVEVKASQQHSVECAAQRWHAAAWCATQRADYLEKTLDSLQKLHLWSCRYCSVTCDSNTEVVAHEQHCGRNPLVAELHRHNTVSRQVSCAADIALSDERVKQLGFAPRQLQALWRDVKTCRRPKNEILAAVIETLVHEGVAAWPGDATECVAQMVKAQYGRAEAAEAALEKSQQPRFFKRSCGCRFRITGDEAVLVEVGPGDLCATVMLKYLWKPGQFKVWHVGTSVEEKGE